ncbi:hypothetical protein DR64_1211 [Paraburkholderia xenovorans LB400]|uniref:Uncharacterized protein n=1 Tax=Paraburkholderia xenovorans (strain LB400) TaxID=266265 RepID=Q143L6_PARXL|nr:hypothetical protein [Paraburkholderia xenovorans]ABE29473.1 hypothetical protein Bxe_A3512 [Paraburkholderia xenovorans LB400]AIP31524.1 hypothetical protein DR64_1211 [Paraburkholderia xenovorans LB400]
MRERIKSSVLGKRKVLTTCLSNPSKADPRIIKSCTSQHALAQLAIPSENIAATSLNSMKKAADRFIEDGGWAKLNSLREAVDSISKPPRTNAARAAEKQKELEEVRKQLLEADRTRLRISMAYTELLRLTRNLVANDPQGREAIFRHQSVWGKNLALTIVTPEKQND